MMAADSDAEASSREATSIISQEIQNQHHQHDGTITTFDADADLKLWLQHTGYFDIEHRQKVLSALRKLKAIDEQRCKILNEIRISTEYLGSPSVSTMLQSPTALESFSSSSLSVAQKTGYVDYNGLLGSQSAAFQGSGGHSGSEISSVNKEIDSETEYMTFNNRRSSRNVQPSIEATTSLDDPDYDSQEAESPSSLDRSVKEESHRFVKGRSMRNYTPSQILSLVPKQESRYFLIKSFNSINVDMSQRDGLWITKAKNGALFANAFQNHKNVYLIFSVNKSKAFQGYARMTTPPTNAIIPAKWMNNISWKASDPFRIQWLNTNRTEFWKLGDLKNPFNDGKPIFVGRDGQEFPEACGRRMIRVMDRGVKERNTNSSWGWGEPCHGNKDELSTWQNDESKSSWGWDELRHGNKDEVSTRQHDESSEAEEAVSASTEANRADMPLIEY